MSDPFKILNKKTADKAELREALAAALGVPCPAFVEKPSEVQQMRSVWREFYLQQTGTEYQFAIRDNVALVALEKMINNILTDNATLDAWCALLQNLPEFYRTKALTLTAIRTGFNGIIASIKTAKHGTGISQSYAAKIAETLCS